MFDFPSETIAKDGGPAFPKVPDDTRNGSSGMSLRDWFAGQAMDAAREDYRSGVPDYDLKAMFGERVGLTRQEIVCALAYRYADAMLAARAQSQEAQS